MQGTSKQMKIHKPTDDSNQSVYPSSKSTCRYVIPWVDIYRSQPPAPEQIIEFIGYQPSAIVPFITLDSRPSDVRGKSGFYTERMSTVYTRYKRPGDFDILSSTVRDF